MIAMNNLENLATAIGTDIKDLKTQTANSQEKISANTESLNRIATQMDSLATKSEIKQDIDGLAKAQAGSIRQEILNATKDKADKTLVVAEAGKLREEFSNLRVGGVNLLRNTASLLIGDRSKGYWMSSSGGNGRAISVEVLDPPQNMIKNMIRIIENTNHGNKDLTQFVRLLVGEKYTISCYARVASDSSHANVNLLFRSWANDTDLNHKFQKSISHKNWQKYSFTFTADAIENSIQFGQSGAGIIEICAPKIESGTLATDWSPAPEDAQTQVTETQESLRGLERKFETIASDVKVLNQKPEPRLTLTGNTLSIAGGNNVTIPIPDNVGHEIRGTGSPEGRIAAEIGTTYVDVNVTNGALKWIKQSGSDNTGWKVIHGDTGWVLGWQQDMHETLNVDVVNRMYFRRINDVVHVKFDPKIQTSTVSTTANLVLENGNFNIMYVLSINGFRPINDIAQTIFQTASDFQRATTGAENSEVSQGTGCVMIQYYEVLKRLFVWQLQIVASKQDNHVNPFSYLTEDDWPTTLL